MEEFDASLLTRVAPEKQRSDFSFRVVADGARCKPDRVLRLYVVGPDLRRVDRRPRGSVSSPVAGSSAGMGCLVEAASEMLSSGKLVGGVDTGDKA